jgi:hypothetical protein
MTNANLPDRWLLEPLFDSLSDTAWRVHTFALMWSNQQGTDGHLPATSLRYLYPTTVPRNAIEELVNVKLWKRVGSSEFLILDWAGTQTPAAVVEAQRQRKKANQQASRARRKTPSNQESSPDSSPVTSPVAGKTRPDETRPGQEDSAARRDTSGLPKPGEYRGGPVAWNGSAA